jgi:hypothetical protein
MQTSKLAWCLFWIYCAAVMIRSMALGLWNAVLLFVLTCSPHQLLCTTAASVRLDVFATSVMYNCCFCSSWRVRHIICVRWWCFLRPRLQRFFIRLQKDRFEPPRGDWIVHKTWNMRGRETKREPFSETASFIIITYLINCRLFVKCSPSILHPKTSNGGFAMRDERHERPIMT